jgi:hypothetical protein
LIPLSLFSQIIGNAVLLILAVDVVARLLDDTRRRWRTRRDTRTLLREVDAFRRTRHSGRGETR